MTFGVRGLLAAMVMLCVSGCVSGPTAVPFDSTQAGKIKTIGILTPGTSAEPRAILATTVGQSFGLIGAIIDAGMQESRESDLKALLNGQNYDARAKYLADLKASLEARGYKVVDVPVARTDQSDFKKSYLEVSASGVDAYLDTVYHYGYISAGVVGSAPYRPFVYLGCRLVKPSDGSVLMEDRIYYNALNNPKNVVTLPPDPAYVFPDFADVTRDPKKTAEGLDVAFKASTTAIVQLIQ
ncbi:MAG: hypothetical protein Q7T44_10905 [Parvibaculum sp.]|nr:hypothetical protein [Parvibaculum sp.]